MTVESTTNRAQYATNGTTGPWTVPWQFYAKGDVQVIYADASGNETVLGDSDYSVTGTGDESGGTVTTTTAYGSGGTITLLMAFEALQEVDYTETDAFPAETHERALDLLTRLVQQIKEVTGRALVIAPSENNTVVLPKASARANKSLAFDSDGDLTVLVPTSGSAADVLVQLANSASASLGPALVGYDPALAYAAGTVGHALTRHGVLVDAESGIDSSGATDCTLTLQTLIDANKGKRIVFASGIWMIGGLSLNGSSYNNTQIAMLPGAKFKLAPDGGNSTFGGAWVGLLIKDCSGVQLINVNWDGNKAAMTATREQIGCIGIAGATDYLISGGTITEIQGDGIWVGQSDWLSNSTVPLRGRITGVRGRNATASGRNFITVISCNDLEIDHVDSRLIGGVINGTTMPAGICVEPDQSYHTVNDLRIHSSYVMAAGTSGVAILGKSLTGVDASEDWNCTNCSVKDVSVRLVTGVSAGPAFSRITGLDLDIEVTQESGTRRKLLVIDAAERVYGRCVTRGGSVNVSVGEAYRVRDFGLEVQAYDYENAGLKTCDVDYGMFKGVIYGALNNINSFAIQLDAAGRTVTQTAVTYSIDARADGNNLRAVRLEPGAGTLTFTNTRLANCDMSGYSTISNGLMDAGLYLPASNVVGLTDDAPAVAFTSLDATPSVGLPARHFACANAAPTSITMFDDGYDNREFVLRMDNNTTIVHDIAKIITGTATNITGRTSNDHVMFRRISGIWFEQSRSW